jgi:hypothetical protein
MPPRRRQETGSRRPERATHSHVARRRDAGSEGQDSGPILFFAVRRSSTAPHSRANYPARSHFRVFARSRGPNSRRAQISAFSQARRHSGGRLRDEYEYVTTPLVQHISIPINLKPQQCALGGCVFGWRPDWLSDPESVVTNPSPEQQVSFTARILQDDTGGLFAVGNPADVPVDLRPSMSQTVAALFARTDISWLTPIEPGARGRQGGVALQAVAMPAQWRQAARPVAIIAANGGINTFEANSPGPTPGPQMAIGPQIATLAASVTSASTPVRYIPGDRDDARALFSGHERAVYLVGGHRLDGPATGEVWRYQVVGDEWTHLFLPVTGVAQPQPGNVRALAYDDLGKRIALIDDVIPPATAPRPRDVRNRDHEERDDDADERDARGPQSRLLVLDLAANRIRRIMLFPRTAAFAKIGLVAQDDGSFILVTQRTNQPNRWDAFRFRIRDDQHVLWTGAAHGEGSVLDDPFRTTSGIILPILTGGHQELVTLLPSKFDNDDHGVNEL